MSYNLIRLNSPLFHVNLLSALQSRELWRKKKKNEAAASKAQPWRKKKQFPGLVNNHRINVHLSIILNALSKEDNLGVFKHHHLLSEFVMT